MPIQIDDIEVVSLPPAEPAPVAAGPVAAPDLSDQLRAWQRAGACRHDRLRAD
jgi:hypothetical protein